MIPYRNYRSQTYFDSSHSFREIRYRCNPGRSFLENTGKNAKISSTVYFDYLMSSVNPTVIPDYFYNSKHRMDNFNHVDNGTGGFYNVTNEVRSFNARLTPYMMLKDYKILPNFKTKSLSTDMYNRFKNICMMKQIMRPEYTNTTKEDINSNQFYTKL